MQQRVIDWAPTGRVCIWRYSNPRRGWRGWQWAADPAGAQSLRDLLHRMQGGEACHRTVPLAQVTDAVLAVPNAGSPAEKSCAKLRVEYRPNFDALALDPQNELLVLTVGDHRLSDLAAALADLEIGGGDFGIRASDQKGPDIWMFWWMLDAEHMNGKTL